MGIIAKYKFNNTLADLLPEFNSEFTSDLYTVTDEVNGEVTTRTIESDSLPTLMRFGSNLNTYVEGNEIALLEVLDMNTSELTSCRSMFRYCKNLTSVTCEWDTSKVTDMYAIFSACFNLTELDVSNFNTSNVTVIRSMFNNCTNLTALDVSNFDTSKVTNMDWMFSGCTNLTSLDVSNFDTSKVTNMNGMFRDTFLLTDIGVLYCNASTIQKIINAMPTDLNKTLWYKEANINNITYGNNIALKKYIEENIEIVLNSPLLEGDTIEVHDGKLCHYHKMGRVVLDGGEDEKWGQDSTHSSTENRTTLRFKVVGLINSSYRRITYSDRFTFLDDEEQYFYQENNEGICATNDKISINILKSKISGQYSKEFRQWLQANPTTVVYELASPYYEDITPYQSSITLRTFEECNVQIITALPIKTKITYRTNITSAVVLEQELDTLDSGVSLSNLIEEEVDE